MTCVMVTAQHFKDQGKILPVHLDGPVKARGDGRWEDSDGQETPSTRMPLKFPSPPMTKNSYQSSLMKIEEENPIKAFKAG